MTNEEAVPEAESYEFDTFISYATPNRDKANEICRYLESIGNRCWIAPRNVRPGKNYGEEIDDGIARSRCFVVVVSSASNNSRYVQREVEMAVSMSKPVFPVRLEDVPIGKSLKFYLASIQVMDIWDGDLDEKLRRLSAAFTDPTIATDHRFQGQTRVSEKARRPGKSQWAVLAGVAATILILAAGYAIWGVQSSSQPPAAANPASTVQPNPAGRIVNEHATASASSAVKAAALQDQLRALEKCNPQEISYACLVDKQYKLRVQYGNGTQLEIPGGTGSSTEIRRSQMAGTLIPRLSNQMKAAIVLPGGKVSDYVSLAAFEGSGSPVVLVPSDDNKAPILTFGMRTDASRSGEAWRFYFFSPWDTTQVEWSPDGNGFMRVSNDPVTRYRGVYVFDPSGMSGKARILVRWRVSGGDWEGPVAYSVDMPVLESAIFRQSFDLANAVDCRMGDEINAVPIIKCAVKAGVAGAARLASVSWSLDGKTYRDAQSRDYSEIESTVLSSPPPKPGADCGNPDMDASSPVMTSSSAKCVGEFNAYKQWKDQADFMLRSLKKSMSEESDDCRCYPVAIAGQHSSIYFRGVTKAGEHVAARVPVKE